MLISCELLQKYWNVSPSRIVHIGAHEAEEFLSYKQAGWGETIWVEAQSEKVDLVRSIVDKSGDSVIEAAVWDESGIELELQIMNNTQSTSLLNLGTHKESYPDIIKVESRKIKTKILDEIVPQNFGAELIALDIQGAELMALKGFRTGIKSAKWIYSEVNKKSVYENCSLIEDMDSYLLDQGFSRKATRWSTDGWGDALYSRNEIGFNQNLIQKIGWILIKLNWKRLFARQWVMKKLRGIIK